MSDECCPNRKTKVTLAFQNTAGPFTVFSGIATFANTLLEVLGLRVISCTVQSDNGTSTAGWLFALRSLKLGTMLASNPFQLGVSVNNNAISIVPFTDVIGFGANGVRTQATDQTFQDNLMSHGERNLNCYLPFARADHIDTFDWSVQPLVGAWTLNTSYTIEIVLEFSHKCHCLK